MSPHNFRHCYSSTPTVVIGFHGCTKEIAHKVLNRECDLAPSNNDYDWLGPGIYFWEANPSRAVQWAKQNHKDNGAVIGAFIQLGHCLNLLDSRCLGELRDAYILLEALVSSKKMPLPKNTAIKNGFDLLNRKLDCAVINTLHEVREKRNELAYDTVRGVFWEGNDLYPNAGFKEKNHVQIAVRNSENIIGFFSPHTTPY